jgi:hypothetical protein
MIISGGGHLSGEQDTQQGRETSAGKPPTAQLTRLYAADRLFSVSLTRITSVPECAVSSVGFLWGSAAVSLSCGVSVGLAEAPTGPADPREADSPHPAADLAEITRIYGVRHWIEQSYRQVKDQLGWADFQVRSDTAIRRHQALVNCAFCFCWDAWFAENPPQHDTAAPRPEPGRGERGAVRRLTGAGTILAPGAARGTRLAFPLDRAAALVAGMVQGAPAPAAAGHDRLGRGRLRPAPLHPYLTNYRQSCQSLG